MQKEEMIIKYMDLLREENEKQNLLSRKSMEEELNKHVEDSQVLLKFVSLENKKVIDIGSGAGFPALVLAMSSSLKHLTLVESDLKKSEFLKRVIKELALDNVEVLRERAEEIGQNELYREKSDYCTSRAVAPLNIMLEYSLPLLNLGGKAYMWKGRNYAEEIEASETALKLLGGSIEEIFHYNLLEERDRVIIAINKTSETASKYPRRVGVPSKRPL